MSYSPVSAVWELSKNTMAYCNHNAKPGSKTLPDDDLTNSEAVELCAALGSLGVQRVCLSGAQPAVRPDWLCIVEKLRQAGVAVSLMTNGWEMDKEALRKAQGSGVDTILLNIDGVERTHDACWQTGSFKKNMGMLDGLLKTSIECQVVSTITTSNIGELLQLVRILESKNVAVWKLQPAFFPNDTEVRPERAIEPKAITAITALVHAMKAKTSIAIQIDQCVNYFGNEQFGIGERGSCENLNEPYGCGAGITTFGILHNGDIVGCPRMRGRRFIEGSIRKKKLFNIWYSPASFLWNRTIKKERLTGFCAQCRYGRRCRGGCVAARLAGSGDIFGENKYCSYGQSFSKAAQRICRTDNVEEILAQVVVYIEQKKYQLAELLLWQGLSVHHDHSELNQLYRFVNFMVNPNETDYIHNYEEALAVV